MRNMGRPVAQHGSIRGGAAAAETSTNALQTRIMVLSFPLLSWPILDQGYVRRSVGSPAKRRWDLQYSFGGRETIRSVDSEALIRARSLAT